MIFSIGPSVLIGLCFFYRVETSAPGLSGYYWYIVAMFVGTKSPPVEFMAILGMTMPPIHSQFSKGITCWVLLVWVPLLLSYYNLQNLPYIIISCFRSTRSVIAVKWFRWFALWRCAPSRTPPKHWLKSNAPWNPAARQRHWRFSQSLFSYFDVSILLVEFVSQKSMGLYLFRLAGSGIWKSLVASWWILGQLKWHPETFFSVLLANLKGFRW